MRGSALRVALRGALCDAEEDEEEVVMRAIVSDASPQFDAERIALRVVAHHVSGVQQPLMNTASLAPRQTLTAANAAGA
jgi:hypothetical protein